MKQLRQSEILLFM